MAQSNLLRSDSMKLVVHPSDILRRKCEDIKGIEFVPSLSQITDEMYEVMTEHGGIGLAGPQVGLPYNIFIIKNSNDYEAFFNPRITWMENSLTASVESCLSLPGIIKTVLRSKSISMEYLDFSGKRRVKKFDGIKAICVQHEIDHLNGKLIIDY